MPLTDIKIRQAKAGDKPTKLTDGNGLYLLVKPSGSKLWRYKYRIAGKENVFAIGEYPAISLQAARVARDDARELVKKGLHPSHARREVLSARISEGKATFRAISDEWLEKKRKTWTERHLGEIQRMLEADAYPYIGNRPMRSITAHEVLTLMRRVEKRGSPSVAIKLRQYVSNVFQYAVITLRADTDPASVLRGAVLKPPTEHARPLSREELKALFRQLPMYRSRRTTIAIRLLMMLFPRTAELCRARWEEIDLAAAEWRVPPEKIKSRRLHIVPLPTQALSLLRELQEIYGDRGYILPILHSNRKRPHMSRATINRALDPMMQHNPEPITGHDFRATASTNLHEMGWKDEVVEIQLSHKDKDKTRSTYNHAKYLPERRDMMQAWANWLDVVEEEAGTNNGTVAASVDDKLCSGA
ncbi:tyrosine-type recombinase/integrase [Burkholderia territorii]|uniref:Tyrosine-type recombinase/integrase n=1 Tax=Burkholderia territorii TaxID=1503055 RepID=A0A6L3NLN6_9BURK|nr:integrase arm-type DNA-binding domain-containing protein [Burkholderia territorii]KAB0685374.1 tyrosine-type recombinase/integrase [Burkholderia territorii]VWB65190.1 integrase [Burkholderia territorii]